MIGSNAPASLRGVGCHEPFETQAARKPDSVAVIDETGCMTYAELNGRANRLARELRALGARRGALVGIHLERSPEMLVAVLAVLKSGAAYVPLDPAFPTRRCTRGTDHHGAADRHPAGARRAYSDHGSSDMA